jgi:hypothetical protein
VDRVPLWIKLLAVVIPVATILSGLSRPRTVAVSPSAVAVLDPFADVAGTVAALHRQRNRANCELSAGVWEPDRPDAGRFDPSMIGALADHGRWLDIRQLAPLATIIDDRLRLCVAKGFDGVAFDAVDGYRHATGFPLTEADQAAFNQTIAGLARARGLASLLPEPNAPGGVAGSADRSTTSGS